jgi:hypothetical protein
MARNSGLLKIEGTLGELTFYKSKDGFLVRTKGGISKSRIESDPAFSRTRENGKEFGQIARSGKVLRDAIRPLLLQAKDSRVTSRLVKVMASIKNVDGTSTRGNRTVFNGLATPEGKAFLKGFDFNNKATLGSILFAPLQIDVSTGTISFSDFIARNQLVAPSGSTHVSLLSAYASVDFTSEDSQLFLSDVVTLSVDDVTPQTFDLVPSSVPAGTGTKMILFLMSFSQEVNGSFYEMRNGAFNVLNVVEVI